MTVPCRAVLAPLSLLVAGGAPAAPALLCIGRSRIDAPVLGGVLVPAPEFVVVLAASAAGELRLDANGPAGIAPGTRLWCQAWFVDAANRAGFAASNGLMSTAR